jgi:hypothetical protein
MDLDIALSQQDIDDLRESPLEGELMETGKPLGKKLIIKHEYFESHGDGIEVTPIKSDPEGGWDAITAFEVRLNEHAYFTLRANHRTGSRHALGAHITLYGPRESPFPE